MTGFGEKFFKLSAPQKGLIAPVAPHPCSTSKHKQTQANTEKKGLTFKNLQPEKDVLHSRDIFKTERVISVLILCLNILNYDVSNCGMEDKGQQWSTPALHTPRCNAMGRCQLWSGSHKAAWCVVQMTYLAFPQGILTQMLTHLHHFEFWYYCSHQRLEACGATWWAAF